MMRSRPFERVKLFLSSVAAALSIAGPSGMPVRQITPADMPKLQGLEQYRSRGKGRGTVSYRYGNKPGKYAPHQGKRECARRRRQIRQGILTRANGLVEIPRVPQRRRFAA